MKSCKWMVSGLLVSVVLVGVATYIRGLSIVACGGEFVYPIDDTYIHIVMAKQLACCGTWGVEPDKMAFCSSSPLWTLLLCGLYKAFGVCESLPWFLSLGFNVLAMFVVARSLSRYGASVGVCFGGAFVVALSGPFICTTALGMEHAMHGFLILAAIIMAEDLHKSQGKDVVLACAIACAATATRYESLFVLLPLAVGLAVFEAVLRWRERRLLLPLRSIIYLAASAMPVFVYGIWAVLNGGHFLPNSLLLKGNFMTLGDLVRAMILLFGSVRPGCGFLYLLMVALGVAAMTPKTRSFFRLAAASCIVAICGQLLFADVGQLCRYEAFLTAVGAFVVVACVISGCIPKLPAARYASLAVFIVTGLTFISRAERSCRDAVRAASDIRNQQVLMTRIMAELPPEDKGCVALNDLGYMSLHGGFPILDMWGLGSQDATELLLKHKGTYKRSDYEELYSKHHVKYAVVFEKWYPSFLMPSGTVDVATLTLKDNFVCGSDKVVFRATSDDAADRLQRHLEKYVDRMPDRARLWICR